VQDAGYTVFIAFAVLWILMGIGATIALFKSDGQKLRFGKWGLLVAIPILVPIVLVLAYQIFRPSLLQLLR
jgi:zinc transporter ZupT